MDEDLLTGLRAQNLRINCLRMTLRETWEGGRSYEGTGELVLGATGELAFTLWLVSGPVFDGSQRSPSAAGTVIPRSDRIALEALDQAGRTWHSEFALVQRSRHDNGIQTLFGQLPEGVWTRDLDRIAGGAARLYFFQPFPPFWANQTTETREVSALGSSQDTRHNVAVLREGSRHVVLADHGDYTTVDATVGRDSEWTARRVQEGLRLALGAGVSAAAVVTNVATGESYERRLRLRPFEPTLQRTSLPAPMYTVFRRQENLLVFMRYLDYAASRAADEPCPIALQHYEVLQAFSGSLMARALTAAIAAEALAQAFFDEEGGPSPDLLAEIEQGREVVKAAALPQRVRDILLSSLGHARRRTAARRLRALASRGVVGEQVVRSWSAVRNPLAHGSIPQWEVQEALDHLHAVVTLFYQLVFNVIGYTGTYTDYSTRGHPLAVYGTDAEAG